MDYRSSRSITHDYDAAVLGEGITTLFAMPVRVQGKTRGLLYCGSWSQTAPSAPSSGAALDIARELATELQVRQEVRRHLAAARPTQSQVSPSVREEIRESYAELRSIAAGIDDPVLRARITNLEQRLISLARNGGESVDSFVHLSPRETDVLACVGLGATNGQIAAALGLAETTVKSYIHAASAKLNASTRHSAVAKARGAGLLP
jgi:DNA-binding CsgD family transcriptional regulator